MAVKITMDQNAGKQLGRKILTKRIFCTFSRIFAPPLIYVSVIRPLISTFSITAELISSDFICVGKSCIKKWTEKDIKKVDPYSIRNKINECPKLKTKEIFSCYIYDSKLDNLGKKEEFG